MKNKVPPQLQAELNVAWMHFVQATGGIIEKLDPDVIGVIKAGFENGYVAGAIAEASAHVDISSPVLRTMPGRICACGAPARIGDRFGKEVCLACHDNNAPPETTPGELH